MKKYGFFILTSSNQKLLKVCYNTVLNQKNHNIDYDIIIVVNSLNSDYYNDVCVEFKDNEVEIIQTESNGKPGKGHNSLINLFKIRRNFDYMMMIDGDDFLYPYALHQIEKCFSKHDDLDMLVLKSTDKLKYCNGTNSDLFNIYIHNNFMIESKVYVDYKLYPWNAEHMHLSNMYKNSLCTPIRLFLISRKVLNYIEKSLFHEDCDLYDDYLLFLNFIRLSQNQNLKTFIIPGKYIYLYNSINNNSQTNQNNNPNDMEYYDTLKSEFKNDCKILGDDWDLTKLPTLYISNYSETTYKYSINEVDKNINMNINMKELQSDKNFKYIEHFGNTLVEYIINSYYEITLLNFENANYKNSLKYSSFYIDYNIINPFISFIYVFSYFNLNQNSLNSDYIEKIKKNIKIADPIIKLYNIESFNQYCKAVMNQNFD